MSEVLLSKQMPLSLTEPERMVMRRVLFESVDGLDERSKKGWRRFWNMIVKAEPGEVFSVQTWFPRIGVFHRRHMLMEQRVFQAQERIESFDRFRTWAKIGMGFCDWLPGPAGGGVIPVPKSIAYRNLDEEGMREFHESWLAFLRTERAQRVLWPHLSPHLRSEMLETVIGEFER